ncbi:MAG: relaxase domain-containing protein [Oligoflexia bacterium]|nr:relaxase domain-containing protein [Oligoflexia bacterium]
MLSLTTISSGGATEYYRFAGGEYYEKGAKVSEWIGAVAKDLGLDGKEVDFKIFDNLVKGFGLDGEKLVKSAGEKDHRAGMDLTFGAPKSVSILAMSDPRIRDACFEAVKETLKYVEENYLQTRVMEDGEKRVENTGKMLASIFEHHTNRLRDPHLHFHAVVMNLTKDLNNQFKTIHNDKIFIDQKHIGLIFRAYLAPKLKELGYTIEITDRKEGFFEIKGVPNEVNRYYSKRQEEVEKRKEELEKLYPHLRHGKLTEMAALDTRLPKAQELSKDELRSAVNEGLKNFNTSLHELHASAIIYVKSIGNVNDTHELSDLTESIKESVNSIEANKSAWKMTELINQTIKITLGNYSPDQIHKEVKEFIKSDQLSCVGTKRNFEYFATKEMQKIELKVVEHVRDGKNKSSVYIDVPAVNKVIAANPHLTPGQKDALNFILTAKDRIIGIQGDAGTGKTHVMDSVRAALTKTPFTIRGLAPTGKAQLELQSGAHLEKSETIDSFLLKSTHQNFSKQISSKKEIWVVDEAGMIGSKKMERLLDLANKYQAKVVLTGDVKQFTSIDQGKIFSDLQKEGQLIFVEMKDLVRQRTEEAKAIVKGLSEYMRSGKDPVHLKSTFDLLKSTNKIVELTDDQLKIATIKDEYLHTDKSKSVLILTNTNQEKEIINQAIRTTLKEDGRIDANGFTFPTLSSLSLSGTAQMHAESYNEQQVVFFEKQIGNIKSGTFGVIAAVDKNEIIITQFDKKNPERKLGISLNSLNQLKKIQVFNKEKKEFAVGDKIIFGKKDKYLGVKNGHIGTIKKINHKGEVVALVDNKKIKFNLSEIGKRPYSYINHAYALTEYKSQGTTVDKLIWSADAKKANFNSAYVAVTRIREDIKIFTNSVSLLEKNIGQENSKTSSLEFKIAANQIGKSTERELFNIPPMSKDIHEIDHHSKNISREIER